MSPTPFSHVPRSRPSITLHIVIISFRTQKQDAVRDASLCSQLSRDPISNEGLNE